MRCLVWCNRPLFVPESLGLSHFHQFLLELADLLVLRERADEKNQDAADEEWPTLEGMEKAYIKKVLKKCGYRLTGARGAAGLLGIHYTTLKAKMEKYNIT